MNIGKNSAEIIANKIKMVIGKEVIVANDRGFILFGDDKGEFSLSAHEALKSDKNFDKEKGILWKSVSYEGTPIGVFGIRDMKISEETLSIISGMAEVMIYQYFILKKIYSVTDMRANFIKDLLINNRFQSFEEAIPEADILRVNLRGNQAVIFIDISGFIEDYLKTLDKYNDDEKKVKVLDHIQEFELLIKKAFKDDDQNVVVYSGENKFILLKGISGENITTQNSESFLKEKALYLHKVLKEKLPKSDIAIGVGQYYPNIEGLKKSYQDALIAITIGIKVWETKEVYHVNQVGTFAVLSGEISHKRKIEISKQVLGELLNDKELLKTVKSFLSSGMNLTEASSELHLHRNTLIYRLNKVKKLIGLDPKKFSDALQIKLGLLICQVK